jgi:thiamine biosynthesis lipoprotein
MQSETFDAMGTTIELILDADDAGRAFAEAALEFERLEQVMSRFRPDSELSRLNAHGVLDVSPDLAEVIELAVAARARTGGRFDPTVHDAVAAAGYDRTFEELETDTTVDAATAPCGGRVEVDGLHVEIEPGFRLDLGGIGKGFAAERVAQQLALAGPCLVNAGGDIAVRGVPAEGFWPVGVEEGPTLGLAGAGLATSGRDRRRWRRGGRELHHLIDPRTGAPAESDLVRVTAVGHDAVDAEVLAKVLLLAGEAEAVASGVPSVLVTADGRTVLAGGIG